VFTFDKPIAGATATITEGTATTGTPTFSGNDVIVGLTNVTNQQYVTVSLTNVTSTDGGTAVFAVARAGRISMSFSGWIADYPDADNFMQLLYGPNIGQANDSRFNLPEFNKLYE
jgi:ABC-type oligopeptide transport system substrate-binding subunit